MNFNRKELKNIAAKVIAGKASIEEIEFINQYYDLFDKEADVSEELSAEEKEMLAHEISAGIMTKVGFTETAAAKYNYGSILKIAAAVLLLLAASYLMFKPSFTGKNKEQVTAKILSDVAPGGDNATLTLADGSSYELNQLGKKAVLRKGNLKIEKTKDGLLVVSVLQQSSGSSPSMNTITTPRGGQYEVVLPDGSRVLLNAASSLKFPDFFDGNKRQVELTGEAYFEITHLAAKPFLVKSNHATIQVLGTQFNVMAYDPGQIKTTLVEGSVNLKSSTSAVMLIPGEQGVMSNNGNINRRKVDVDKEISWRKGWFSFNESSIENVMDEISRWYDVDVLYAHKMPHKEITGRVPRNAKLSVVLDMLQYSGFEFEIKDRTIKVK